MKQEITQSGRTMIETIAVLSIIGALITSITIFVYSMYDKYKSSTVISQIRDLRKAINNRYAAIGVYTGLNSKILIDERLAPSQMVHGQKLIHVYEGEVTLSVSNTGGKGRSYKISFPALPQKNCVELATINWEVDNTATLVGITINKKAFSWEVNTIGSGGVTAGSSATALPITMGKAAVSCQRGEANEIIWEFQ